MLLSLSVLVVYVVLEAEQREAVSAVGTDTPASEKEVVTTAEQTPVAESEEAMKLLPQTSDRPVLAVEVLAGEAGADLFATSQFEVVGYDTRNGELYNSSATMQYEEAVEGELAVKRVAVTGYPTEYNDTVQIAVVGLQRNNYRFTGAWIAADGEQHELSFAREIHPYDIDTVTVNLKTGEYSEQRENYDAVLLPETQLTAATPACDYTELASQLDGHLEAAGWSDAAVATKTVRYGMYEEERQALPFDYEAVCAVEVVWSTASLTEKLKLPGPTSVLSAFPYSQDVVEVNGEQFRQQPSDGPMGSGNLIPYSKTGDGVQLYEVQSLTKLLPVRFPVFTLCPCAIEERVILTAPMYPEGHPLRSGE